MNNELTERDRFELQKEQELIRSATQLLVANVNSSSVDGRPDIITPVVSEAADFLKRKFVTL